MFVCHGRESNCVCGSHVCPGVCVCVWVGECVCVWLRVVGARPGGQAAPGSPEASAEAPT